MSNLYIKRVQIGNSTAPNNFTIQQPDTANGTMVIGNGNIGSTTTVLTLNSSGNLTLTGSLSSTSVSTGSISATSIAATSTLTVNGANVLTATNAPYLGTNSLIRTNASTISENITIPSGTSGMTAGPVTIASGFTVTVNGDWSVV